MPQGCCAQLRSLQTLRALLSCSGHQHCASGPTLTHLMLLANCGCDSWRSSALRASVALSRRSSRRPSGLRPAMAAPQPRQSVQQQEHRHLQRCLFRVTLNTSERPEAWACDCAPAECLSRSPTPPPNPRMRVARHLTLRQALLLHLLLQLVPLESRDLVAQLYKAHCRFLEAQQGAQNRHLHSAACTAQGSRRRRCAGHVGAARGGLAGHAGRRSAQLAQEFAQDQAPGCSRWQAEVQVAAFAAAPQAQNGAWHMRAPCATAGSLS